MIKQWPKQKWSYNTVHWFWKYYLPRHETRDRNIPEWHCLLGLNWRKVALQGIIQKKYGCISFWQSQKRLQLGFWGELWRCGCKPPSNFFLYKCTKLVIVRVNNRVENFSNHSVVTRNNITLTFSTIISLSLRNR